MNAVFDMFMNFNSLAGRSCEKLASTIGELLPAASLLVGRYWQSVKAGYPSFRLRYLVAACIPRLRLNKVGCATGLLQISTGTLLGSAVGSRFCAKLAFCTEWHRSLLPRSPLPVLFRDRFSSPALVRVCREPCAGRRRGDVPDPCLTELRITALACETLTAD